MVINNMYNFFLVRTDIKKNSIQDFEGPPPQSTKALGCNKHRQTHFLWLS